MDTICTFLWKQCSIEYSFNEGDRTIKIVYLINNQILFQFNLNKIEIRQKVSKWMVLWFWDKNKMCMQNVYIIMYINVCVW